jgi:hypothetical protein
VISNFFFSYYNGCCYGIDRIVTEIVEISWKNEKGVFGNSKEERMKEKIIEK